MNQHTQFSFKQNHKTPPFTMTHWEEMGNEEAGEELEISKTDRSTSEETSPWISEEIHGHHGLT